MQKRRKKEFEEFFQFYSCAIKIRQLFFIYPFLTQKIIDVLRHLENKAIISGYSILNLHSVKVFLRYDITKNLPLFQKIIFVSSNGRKRFVSSQKLKAFIYYYPKTFTLLNTKYGILTPQQCLKLNCGGELILIIT